MGKRKLPGLRKDKGLKQEDVAAGVNINLDTYRNYEARKTLPNIKKADEIAAFLGVNTSDIEWYDE